MAEKLTCDFCQREIETRRIPSARFGVVVFRDREQSKLLTRDACQGCADELCRILSRLERPMIDELVDRLTPKRLEK